MKRLKVKLKQLIIRLSQVRYMNRVAVLLLDTFLSVFSTLMVILFVRFGLWRKLIKNCKNCCKKRYLFKFNKGSNVRC